MKKFIVLSLFAVLMMAFTPAVYAQAKLDFSPFGLMYVTGNLYRNTATAPPGGLLGKGATFNLDKNVGWLDERFRLGFNMAMGKEVSGTVLFEMDSANWGDTPGGQAGKISQSGTLGAWGGDKTAVEIKNAYLDFAIPGIATPITMRAGLQGLAIRPWIFLATDGMGLTAAIKADPVTIMPLYAKAVEGNQQTADDVDVYGLHMNTKVDTFTIGGYGLYYNMNTYPFFPSNVQGTQKADFWWLGFYADGKAGPVNLSFDIAFDKGKVKSKLSPTVDDVKYSGWATVLKIDYPWEKFNFGLWGAYGSGADRNKTDANGLPGGATKVSSYVTPPGSEQGKASGFGSGIFYACPANNGDTSIAAGIDGNNVSRGSLGGTAFVKLYGSYKATPLYKVTLQGMYIADTTSHGNTYGTAMKADGITYRDDKTIGWEFGLINEFQVYKNLTFSVLGAVLFDGDALDDYSTARGNYSLDTPWLLATNLTYSF